MIELIAKLMPILPLFAFFIVALLVSLFERPKYSIDELKEFSFYTKKNKNKLPKELYSSITILAILTSFIFTLILAFNFLNKESQVFNLITWILLDNYKINIGFLYDNLSIWVSLMVTFVVLMIQIYSTGYMENDRDYPRFFAYLSLFSSGMLMTVLASSLVTFIIGWEIMGLCSYLLIGYWYHKDSASFAAKKAFIITRLGDLGFLLALFILISNGISLDIVELNKMEIVKTLSVLVPIGLMIAAFGKSAQVPLHVWLPDAMEGPTPVSALIHAATMVAAGVYLVARLYPMFYNIEILGIKIVYIVGFIGAISAFLTATMGIVNRDIKRVLAYSTMSQLGYMFAALSAGIYGVIAAIFHLITHGFFKALLFLSAGSVITAIEKAHHKILENKNSDSDNNKNSNSDNSNHNNNSHHHIDPNDIWIMGNLKESMKITFITFTIGFLALAGLFPLSGFFSKDEILNVLLSNNHIFFFALTFITVLLTAFYMSRIWIIAFIKKITKTEHEQVNDIDYNEIQEIHKNIKETPLNMTIPLIILAIFSIIVGIINLPFDLIVNKHLLTESIKEIFKGVLLEEHELHFNIPLALGSTLLLFIGIILAYVIYYPERKRTIPTLLSEIYKILTKRYYFDDFYHIFSRYVLRSFGNLINFIDNLIVDGAVNKVANYFYKGSIISNKVFNGLFYNYYLWITIGLALSILVVLFTK
ncbi:MAG: NADH-quinone oxidoreductase subunit L [bacterium]